MQTGEVTDYKTGREDDEYHGDKCWDRAKVINVYKLKQVNLSTINVELRCPIATFKDESVVGWKAKSEKIDLPTKRRRRE